jgi:hypothetical protein
MSFASSTLPSVSEAASPRYLNDLLVVISMIEQHAKALQQAKPPPEGFKVTFNITTDLPDSESLRLLSQVELETPFDRTPRVQIRPAE